MAIAINSGFRSPTSAYAGGLPGSTWSNPNNTFAADGVAASHGAFNLSSDTLIVTNFGFAIPTNATINGIEVTVKRRYSLVTVTPSITNDFILSVSLTPDIGSHPGIFYNPTTWTNSVIGLGPGWSTNVMGSPTDTWGRTWTPAEINTSDFGFLYRAKTDTWYVTVDVDHIGITVYASLPTSTDTVSFTDSIGVPAITIPPLSDTRTVASTLSIGRPQQDDTITSTESTPSIAISIPPFAETMHTTEAVIIQRNPRLRVVTGLR